jgi:hypothetical protein
VTNIEDTSTLETLPFRDSMSHAGDEPWGDTLKDTAAAADHQDSPAARVIDEND